MRDRIAWIDFAKGFVMILMVFLHCTRLVYFSKFVLNFHIPFFFIMGGFLLNLDKWGGVENCKKFSEKLLKRLIMPYFIAELLCYPIWFVVCHKMGYMGYLFKWNDIDSLDAFTAIFIGNGNAIGLILGPMWFLPALFFTEIIFIVLYNHLNKFGGEIFTLAIIFFSYIGFKIFILPMGMDIALVAQIFLLMGVLIRKYNLVELLNPKFCGLLMLIAIVVFYFNEHVDMNFRRYGDGLMFYMGGIAGSLLVMKFSVLMTSGKIFSLISDCGRQSMMILVLHPIIANIFYEVLARAGFNPEVFFLEPTIIFGATALGVLIPLLIAKKFGKLPVLRYFCP